MSFLLFELLAALPDIVDNGFTCHFNDGLLVIPITKLLNVGYLQPTAGIPVGPLAVRGLLLTACKQTQILCLRLNNACTDFTEVTSL